MSSLFGQVIVKTVSSPSIRMVDSGNQLWKNRNVMNTPQLSAAPGLRFCSQKETPFLTLRVLEGTGMRSQPVAEQQEEDLRCPDLQIFLCCFPEGSFVNRAHYQGSGLILSLVECSRMKKEQYLNSYCCFGVQEILENT